MKREKGKDAFVAFYLSSLPSPKEYREPNMKKILIVDDEQDIVESLKFVLEASGFDCYCAYNGEEGLNMAREISPDLIILDVMMPKINGYKICRLLKYDNKYKNIPILMVTARSQDEDKSIGEETGVDEYITKPFELDDIVKKVEGYLCEK